MDIKAHMKTKPILLPLSIVLILTLVIAACAKAPGSPDAPTPSPAAQSAVYPNPSESNLPAYPSSLQNGLTAVPYPATNERELVATAGPIPSPDTNTGVVVGKLINNGKPLPDAILYLAEVKKAENGKELMAAINLVESPRAYTDTDGNFVFPKIPPGKYGLVLSTVIAEYLLPDPNQLEKELLFIVEAGKTAKLGDLAYTDLPVTTP